MKVTLKSILLIIFVLSSSSLFASEKEDTLRVLFHQGRSQMDRAIPGNQATLLQLDSILNDSNRTLRSINIIGAASPEGGVELNRILSDNRALRILKIIEKKHLAHTYPIDINFLGRDWNGLYNIVKIDSSVPNKYDVEHLLGEIVEKKNRGESETETDHYLELVKNLDGGEPYRYMYYRLFPKLRASDIILNYYDDIEFNELPSSPDIFAGPIYKEIDFDYLLLDRSEKERKNFYMALKSNLLYDALALPSLSAEFYLGKNISIVGNWTYGWWDNDHRHRYWRAYGGDLAVRWWFGKKAHNKPLTGHHLGIYGGILTYDFEFGGKGYMGGLPGHTLWNRSLRMAGIEYGYSLPVAKRFNIDFTIGIGYLGGKYIKYIPSDGRYLWQSTHRINWFGPTKAEISLVWLIGRGNVNTSRKGGRL